MKQKICDIPRFLVQVQSEGEVFVFIRMGSGVLLCSALTARVKWRLNGVI
jgi:hypothetical protein